MIAKAIGQDTPFPSLELATEDFTGFVGACDVGYSCTYMNTISWQGADHAAADGDQPARRVRAAVRRHRHGGGAARAHADAPQHPGLGVRSRRRSCSRASAPATSRGSSEYLGSRPRDRAPHRAVGAADRRRPDGARGADRRARGVRGARRPDVRPAGGGVPGRHHPRLHVHDGARPAQRHVSRRSASTSRTTGCRTTRTSPTRSRASPRSTPTTSTCSAASSRS